MPEAEALPTHFTIVRHAPTLWNLEGRIQGNQPTDINPNTVDTWWGNVGKDIVTKPDLIVTSGLRRSTQTADVIIERKGWAEIPVVADERLNERRWGVFEGKSPEEVRAMLRQQYSGLKDEDVPTLLDSPGFRVKNGETVEEVLARSKLALSDLARDYPGKRILMVSHAGVMSFLGLEVTGVSQFELNKANQDQEIKIKS